MTKSEQAKTPEPKDGVDMISNLPAHVLQLILPRLQGTEEIIRTCILSTRWRYLWTSVPSIDIDSSRRLNPHQEFKENRFEEFVNRVLANESINLDSFRLSCGDYYNMSTVVWWIDAAVKRNVKLLDLSGCPKKKLVVFRLLPEDIELPNCLVTCSSLEILRLSFYWCLSLPKFTGFPALRVLELNDVDLYNDNVVKGFLKCCPLLEDLILVDCATIIVIDLFCISSPKLKNLRIDNREMLVFGLLDPGFCKRLEIFCRKLVFLELSGFMAGEFILESLDSLKKVVIHPRDTYEWAGNNICALFAGFFHVESLSLRMCLIKKNINLKDLPKSLPNLKSLEFTTTVNAFNMVVLMQILTCFPNLESLHLIIKKGQFLTEDDDLEVWEMECDCIFERLKVVNMMGMSDAPHHMRFIQFLLQSTPCLDTMSITPSEMMTIDRKLSFTIELSRFQRVSPEAEIIFVQDQV